MPRSRSCWTSKAWISWSVYFSGACSWWPEVFAIQLVSIYSWDSWRISTTFGKLLRGPLFGSWWRSTVSCFNQYHWMIYSANFRLGWLLHKLKCALIYLFAALSPKVSAASAGWLHSWEWNNCQRSFYFQLKSFQLRSLPAISAVHEASKLPEEESRRHVVSFLVDFPLSLLHSSPWAIQISSRGSNSLLYW